MREGDIEIISIDYALKNTLINSVIKQALVREVKVENH